MIKIKPLTEEQILISLDRLTRFKEPEVKYLRVFKDLIINNLIIPKYKKSDLDIMGFNELKQYVEEIFKTSAIYHKYSSDEDYTINQKLFEYEDSTFNIDEEVKVLVKNKINYKSFIHLIKEDSSINLRWLKHITDQKSQEELRKNFGLKYPIKEVIISEGITEEILLPEFGKLCNCDFNKKGIHVISAGGKNQVVKLFYKLSKSLRIPIYVLMDKDAKENYNEIKPRLRDFDRVHLIKCGEFEDALSVDLIKKTLSYELNNISTIELECVNQQIGMVKILEEIFKHRGMHEFKKSEFAHMIQKNLNSEEDLSSEIIDIIREIEETLSSRKVMVDN